MRKLFLALTVALLVSCEKSKVAMPICYLATEQTPSSFAAYSYNDKNELVSYATPNIYSSTLTYDASGKIISEFDNEAISITYSYDSKGHLILWSQTIADYPPANFQTKFFVNSTEQDTLQQFFKYDVSTGSYYLWRYTRLSYTSGSTKNYSKKSTYDSTFTLIYTEDFLWDTHPNPYLTNAFFINETPTTNNMSQSTFTIAGDQPQVTNYTYTYNSNGFPLTKTIPGYAKIATYTYTNCK